jgi:hypothetical protein
MTNFSHNHIDPLPQVQLKMQFVLLRRKKNGRFSPKALKMSLPHQARAGSIELHNHLITLINY